MATSGIVYSGYGLKSRFYVKWERTGTWNDTTCGSKLSWSLCLDNKNYWYNNALKVYSIYINGVAVFSGKTWSNITALNSQITLASGTIDIEHNSDGSKDFAISFSGWFYENYKVSGSDTFTLDTIPRSSDFADVTGNLIGAAMTVDITRYNDSFTHTLTYTVGKTTKTVLEKSDATSVTFIPQMELCNEITDALYGIITFELTTYNGSTQIGYSMISSFKIYVPGNIVPGIGDITSSETVEGLAAQFGCFVRYKSKIKIAIEAVGEYGATIKSYSSKLNGITYNGSEFTTGVFNEAGTFSLDTTVTDSRTRPSTKKTNIVIVDYYDPQANYIKAERCTSDGTLDEDGLYAKITYKYDIAPVNNKNVVNAKIQYLDGEEWVDLTSLSGYSGNSHYVSTIQFSADHSFKFRLAVADYFSEEPKASYTVMASSFSLITWLETGKGIAFGKASEKDAIEFGMKLYDRFDTEISNGLTVYTGAGDNAIDPDTTLEHLILTNKKTPMGSYFMYFMTFFYSTKSETANASQFAMPYNATGSMYHRFRSGGVWSAWRRIVNEDEIFNTESDKYQFKKNLDISKNLAVGGNGTITGSLSVTGKITAGNLKYTQVYGGSTSGAISFDPSAYDFLIIIANIYTNQVSSDPMCGITIPADRIGCYFYACDHTYWYKFQLTASGLSARASGTGTIHYVYGVSVV